MHKLTLLALALLVSGCTSSMQLASHAWKKSGIGSNRECTPGSLEGYPKTGNPYTIMGTTYYPLKTSEGYDQQGIASWYGRDFHAKLTANGECYNMFAMTAAHPTLPMPTWVQVTNLENGRQVILRVNDRGPFLRGRLIDLSYRAAQELDLAEQGVGPVRVTALSGEPVGWRDDRVMRGTTRIAQRAPQQAVAQDRVYRPSTTSRLSRQNTETAQNTQGSFTHRISQRQEPVDLEQGKPIYTESAPSPVQQVVDIAYEDLPAGPDPTITEHKFERAGIFIQIGAFGDQANAERQRRLLAERENSAFLMEVTSGGRTLHRVRSGPYETVEAADAALTTLVNAGFNTAIIVVEQK